MRKTRQPELQLCKLYLKRGFFCLRMICKNLYDKLSSVQSRDRLSRALSFLRKALARYLRGEILPVPLLRRT
jgi:hypothetical protein